MANSLERRRRPQLQALADTGPGELHHVLRELSYAPLIDTAARFPPRCA